MTRSAWMKLSIGCKCFDVADEKHIGVVEFIRHGVARVRWIETGWLSDVCVTELRRV